jgi:hypothetical protein
MDISRITLKQKAERLREELSQVLAEMNQHQYPDDADLRVFVLLKQQEGEILSVSIDHLDIVADPRAQVKLHESFNQFKNDVRTAVLRWKCLFSKHHRKKRTKKEKKEPTLQG